MTSIALAVRTLLKAPAFTIVAFVTLALGIGVNTSMYTLMDVLLFRAAPFPEPDRLVAIHGTTPQSQRERVLVRGDRGDAGPGRRSGRRRREGPAPVPDRDRLLGQHDVRARESRRSGCRPSTPRRTSSRRSGCSRSWAGAFTAEEGVPGRNQVALLSYELWQSRFGGDPAVIGRTLRLNAEPVTVIGVMPAIVRLPAPLRQGRSVASHDRGPPHRGRSQHPLLPGHRPPRGRGLPRGAPGPARAAGRPVGRRTIRRTARAAAST